jgi:hypothetical protein
MEIGKFMVAVVWNDPVIGFYQISAARCDFGFKKM